MRQRFLGIIPAALILVQLACNLPSGPAAQANETPTNTQVSVIETATPIPALVETATFTPTLPPQDPLVLRSTLCWFGPGPKYLTVSALKTNERVKLLGRGSIDGWYVVENPIYHDPCWVQATDLQIEPGTDLLSLRVFTPPPLPTPTKPPTITPTP